MAKFYDVYKRFNNLVFELHVLWSRSSFNWKFWTNRWLHYFSKF